MIITDVGHLVVLLLIVNAHLRRLMKFTAFLIVELKFEVAVGEA